MSFSPSLGWIYQDENLKALRLLGISASLALGAATDEIPLEVDNRNIIVVDNQEQTSSCTGHGFTQAAELAEYAMTGQYTQFSRMFAYYRGQKLAGYRTDDGCTLEAVVRAATIDGQVPESVFPFKGFYDPTVPSDVLKLGREHTLKYFVHLTTYDQVLQFLASKQGGVFAGLRWLSGHRDCTGVIERNTGIPLGGHAVSFTGYSKRRDSKRRPYLWMTNSHGLGWANRGHAECNPDAIIEHLNDFGVFYGVVKFNPIGRRIVAKPRITGGLI